MVEFQHENEIEIYLKFSNFELKMFFDQNFYMKTKMRMDTIKTAF